MPNFKGDKVDMFSGGSDLQSVADGIFGSSEAPDSGRVVEKLTPIHDIHADTQQPRRVIPDSIRMHWDGNPLDVPSMLGTWHLVAEAAENERRAKLKLPPITFDVIKLLNQQGEGFELSDLAPVAAEYIELIRLAADIKANKLTYPITLIEIDGKLQIETGERRWVAHHLLNTYLGDEWSKLRAVKVDGKNSLWRQASENTKRRDLNAISLARQFALLLMDLRGTPPIGEGVSYRTYEEVVTAGVCSRRFYAQVADGTLHPIPRGMGETIQSAMGGLSMEQLRHYRHLLRLTDDEQVNDALWIKADVENWSENAMREISSVTPVTLSKVISRANWTIDDLRALKEQPVSTPPQPITTAPSSSFGTPEQLPILREWIRKNVRNGAGRTGIVVMVDGVQIRVVWDDDHSSGLVNYKDLHFVQPRTVAPTPTAAPFKGGDMLQTRLGTVGTVKSIDGREVTLVTASRNILRQNIENLTLYVPQVNEPDIEPDVDPDAPAPTPEYREGWTESEGGNKEAAASVEPKRIIKFGSVDSKFLFTIQQAAQLYADEDALVTVNKIINMTDVDAVELAREQVIKNTLDAAYDTVQALITGHFANILQLILNAAE